MLKNLARKITNVTINHISEVFHVSQSQYDIQRYEKINKMHKKHIIARSFCPNFKGLLEVYLNFKITTYIYHVNYMYTACYMHVCVCGTVGEEHCCITAEYDAHHISKPVTDSGWRRT